MTMQQDLTTEAGFFTDDSLDDGAPNLKSVAAYAGLTLLVLLVTAAAFAAGTIWGLNAAPDSVNGVVDVTPLARVTSALGGGMGAAAITIALASVGLVVRWVRRQPVA
ncbi:MAG: hypothetical protein R2731_07270 [Nocardioides sp.]